MGKNSRKSNKEDLLFFNSSVQNTKKINDNEYQNYVENEKKL